MKLKRYNKRYLPMLWIGLAIWLGTILVLTIQELLGYTVQGQETLMDMGKAIFQRMPIFTLLLLCVLQPILEEFSFRLWGVGKTWMTIICLALMLLFAWSEIHVFGLLFVAAFVAVWLLVKDEFKRMWLLAIISSLCFSLCHISGFSGFSLGMVLGLGDIFGMALVMCWLTININFWCSALLHVLNNSFAILFPMLFLPTPILHEENRDGQLIGTTSLESLKPFEDNTNLIENSDTYSLWYLDSATTEFYMVGEAAEIAAKLAEYVDETKDVFYDWQPIGESLEERLVYTVSYNDPQLPNFKEAMDNYIEDVELFLDKKIVFDTQEVDLMNIIMKYPDGREVNVNDADADPDDVFSARTQSITSAMGGMHGNREISYYETLEDSTEVVKVYVLLHPNPLAEQTKWADKMLEKIYGFEIEYRPERKVKNIVVKVVSDK